MMMMVVVVLLLLLLLRREAVRASLVTCRLLGIDSVEKPGPLALRMHRRSMR